MSIRLPRARLYLAALLCLFTANVFAEDSRTLAATRTAAPASEKKVALVIGNAAYRENPLRNPVNDARAMSAKLKKLGFEVITHENVTALKYGAVLREFRSKLSPGAVALFFYAGHGLQVNGKNYLPAVDAQIQGEEDVPMQSLDLNQVLLTLEDSKTRMNLVFLDACRNNPYARSFRSAAGGLARIDAPSGTLISYATRPGSVAADGAGANGLYTTQLLKHMEVPGQPIEQVLKEVVGGVSDASRGAQEPWMEGSIRGNFYFVPGPAEKPSASSPGPDQESQFWWDAKRTGTLIAYQSYLNRFPHGLYAELALGEIQSLAEGGDSDAQVELGEMYESGRRVSRDYSRSAAWYRKAADRGNPSAQANLGVMYEKGLGVEKNLLEAVNWYRKAAEQGNAKGQDLLGNMYVDGQGVAKDQAQAVALIRKAAEQGHAMAQFRIGTFYARGLGVAKDDAQSVTWYRMAAEQGNVLAQANLGFMYSRGRGVAQDEAQAAAWIRKAAEQGHAHSQYTLGGLYQEGRGVAKDEAQAIDWYRKAAAQGHENAQKELDSLTLSQSASR